MTQSAFPNGHFYSPVVDADEAAQDQLRIWHTKRVLHGIDLNPASHEELLRESFPILMEGYDYPAEGSPDSDLNHFYDHNGQFERQDPRILFCLFKMIRPARIIEIGSGYSTLLMMDINKRYMDGVASIVCIEPYPRPFLTRVHEDGKILLLQNRIQEIDKTIFADLQDGDVIFIDSSHVAKTGSDVVWLILDILPILAAGVYVHFHDIFLPCDYPQRWVCELGFSWNEQYMLQAFLAFNPQFSVIYGSAIAREYHADSLSLFLGDNPANGGSLWLRRNHI